MKRLLAVLLSAVLLLTAFAGCGKVPDKGGKLKIIATIFPVYEWVKEVAAGVDDVDVSLLLDKGVDLHSYQPTAKDVVQISDCDVFVYVGGNSDQWVKDVLKTAENKDMLAINLMETLGDSAKEEEALEGVPAEEEHGDETEYDEHIWLSLRNAAALCRTLGEKLGCKDADHADTYAKNAADYIAKLNALDAQYAQTVKAAKNDTLIFADRFPFRYLTDDYHLKYYAAFQGCSAESEASLQTLVFLANKLDECGLHYLMILDGSTRKIADAVIDTAKTKDVTVLTLNSMQSKIGENDTYLGIMEQNLKVLDQALNEG